MFDTLVFIGRFQPFHNGHKAVVDTALQKAKEVVLVVGSSFQARSTKNPFTFEERKAMIESVYPNDSRLKVVPVMDYPYDDNAWVSAVQDVVNKAKTGTKTGLIGHSKDHSSYYLKIFPDWKNHVEVDNVDGIDATTIRNRFLDGWGPVYCEDLMPKEIQTYLSDWKYEKRDVFDTIAGDHASIKDYKQLWCTAPYDPTFVTTDAVLHQSGYILLIRRGEFPFKKYWALPGGYLEQGITIKQNMVKELREETCVKLPEKILEKSIVRTEIFDNPSRDPRGRTITHGFFIDLGYPVEKLPKVKGGDDAAEAKWFHLSEIKSDMMAFDHYHIIKRFIPTY